MNATTSVLAGQLDPSALVDLSVLPLLTPQSKIFRPDTDDAGIDLNARLLHTPTVNDMGVWALSGHF